MEENTQEKNVDIGVFNCTDCGADLKYKPGTTNLTCEYCGAQNAIPVLDEDIEEQDFHTYLSDADSKEEHIKLHVINCSNCGADSSIEPNITSSFCPYCATPLVIESAHDENVIQPKSLLPFNIDKPKALQEFKKWRNKLWFAPSALKKASLNIDQFKGVYVPYWTYDSDTRSSYTGQRGDYYYETETYTTVEDGKTVTKTRQVRKIRWTFVSGNVSRFFDDILIAATNALPRKYINKLEPWDMQNLVPFDKNFLSGFITEKYQVNLEEGFGMAKDIMDTQIRQDVRSNIGGDQQRIISLNTQHNNIKFKHLLLPIYISAYKFKNKLYRFLVNGRTGEVQGERPWSVWKIIFAILGGLAVIGLIILLIYLKQQADLREMEEGYSMLMTMIG